MRNPLVSIIIVNFNAGALLSRCLESIEMQTIKRLEILIIDNASIDSSLEDLESREDIVLIRNNTNRGFAAAQNQGIRLARSQYVMPLNYDIELMPEFIEQLVRAMEVSLNIGITTGRLMKMTLEGEYLDQIYSTGHVLPANRFAVHRGHNEKDVGQYDEGGEVFGAPGAAPLYRREMLEDICVDGQYFDESLFTWYEDIDLDWRARSLGWRCIYAPTAIAYHVGHPEGHGGNQWQISMTIRNRWLVILANDDIVSMLRNSFALIRYELSLLGYVLRYGYFSAYLRAIGGFVRLIPNALQKRSFTSQRRSDLGSGLAISRPVHPH